MRIEKQDRDRYNKYPNQLEAKLIRIVNRYLNAQNKRDPAVIEAIIDEVIIRLKDEHRADYKDIFGVVPIYDKKHIETYTKELIIAKDDSISKEYKSSFTVEVNGVEINSTGLYRFDDVNLSISTYKKDNDKFLNIVNLSNKSLFIKIIFAKM